jgi:hypothetical protein
MISIVRTQAPPPCLAVQSMRKEGDYKCENTVELLQKDFHNKCYICEQSKITSIEVDHFLPLELRPDLRCEWTNLFFSCGHCNKTKSSGYMPMLDCTKQGKPILHLIRYRVKPLDESQSIRIEALSEDIDVANTVRLLQDVYDGSTTHKALEAENIRTLLFGEVKALTDLIQKYLNAAEHRKARYHRDIAKHLQPDSAFTAFKIWTIWQHGRLRRDFASIIPPELLPSPMTND